jgi:hypothetical protein
MDGLTFGVRRERAHRNLADIPRDIDLEVTGTRHVDLLMKRALGPVERNSRDCRSTDHVDDSAPQDPTSRTRMASRVSFGGR